jgi:hypothetical protein
MSLQTGLWLDRTFKFSLASLMVGRFRPHIGDLLLDGTQFRLGLLAHQVLGPKLFRYVRLKLASENSEAGVAPNGPFSIFEFAGSDALDDADYPCAFDDERIIVKKAVQHLPRVWLYDSE